MRSLACCFVCLFVMSGWYGSGHRAHLREFVVQHPDPTDVSPLDYLPAE